jgi:hypothetical protein
MNAPKEELLRAIDLALAGDWDAAHQLVQQHENDDTAAWIHAVLHKLEGDPGNARYWLSPRRPDGPRGRRAARGIGRHPG